MSVKLTVGQQVINFPTSGTDANWAEAVTQFAEATANALAGVGLTYDVPPQVEELIESGPAPQPLAEFPNVDVRGFTFNYSAYRIATSPTITKVQAGTVTAVYNEDTNVWTLQHEFTGDKQTPSGLPYITFFMDVDALKVETVALGGTSTYDQPNSKISYTAKTLPVTI